jgi:octaprenyl-diphosphate synthase
MRKVGENIGIAFQIKDDLLDYDLNSITGKPSGNDIKEKKLTLPLIYSLNNSSNKDKKHIIKLINNSHGTSNAVSEIIQFTYDAGGIQYAEDKMKQYKIDTEALLHTMNSNDASASFNGTFQLYYFPKTLNDRTIY